MSDLHTPTAAGTTSGVASTERRARDPGPVGRGASPIRGRDVALPRDAWLPLVRERVAGGADVWIRVRGASMEPALPRGALVRLSPLRMGEPSTGDVVLAVLPSGLPVTHRVVAVSADAVTLRGDAMPRRDPAVRRDAVVARVTAWSVDGVMECAVPRAAPWRRLRYWLGALPRFVRARTHSKGNTA